MGAVAKALKDHNELDVLGIDPSESPDFIVRTAKENIAVELTSYSNDAKIKKNKIKSESRKRYYRGHSLHDDGGWIGFGNEIVQIISDKAKSLEKYTANADATQCWLVIHTENLKPFEIIGDQNLAPLQNINLREIIRHYKKNIPFARVYFYDIQNEILFGGPVQ